MTRRSATSSPSRGQPEVVLFVDRSLGRDKVVDALRGAGMRVEALDDHFPQGTLDQDWIPEVTRRGWVILTKDARMFAAVREANPRRPGARQGLDAADLDELDAPVLGVFPAVDLVA